MSPGSILPFGGRPSTDGDTAIRSFLFLQGMATPFFARLAGALVSRGHAVHRINFNGGDRLFWPRSGAVNFRGAADSWPAFLQQWLERWRVTDLVLFGDCRPLHRVAVKHAETRGVRVHVFEEGYLRPGHITLESGGVNGHSRLPRDAAWLRTAAETTLENPVAAAPPDRFAMRALWDIQYNAATLLLRWRYPGYRTHRPWTAAVEYAAGARRMAAGFHVRNRREASTQGLFDIARDWYLFPLQLDADSQIRLHSPYGRMKGAIEYVVNSFAAHAAADCRLVVTEHPLDNGVTRLRRETFQAAAKAGISERTVYLEGGTSPELFSRCRGLVTVNSSLALEALSRGIPVKTLGTALYDIAGLTAQTDLDTFWKTPAPPDAALFSAFRRVLIARTQINGGQFSAAGIRLAVANAVTRLENALIPGN